VGYLNFSGGTSDPKTLAAWNTLYATAVHGKPLSGPPAWLVIRQWLEETTAELAEAASNPAHYNQSFSLIRLLFSEALPAYIDRHKDLLFHQPPESVFSGFFIGRVAESLLQVIAEGISTECAASSIVGRASCGWRSTRFDVYASGLANHQRSDDAFG
jgi:hypothetical protein